MKSKSKSRREEIRKRRQRQKLLTQLAVGAGGLLVVLVIANFIWRSSLPPVGEEVEVMPDSGHVAEGTDPGPYNTDPPTSGRHYESEFDAGFYTPEDVNVPFPAGYLVHNLEHGYVIFWYNCAQVAEGECTQLQEQIRSAMDRVDNFKVIAYPWDSTDDPVVLTSWGRRLAFSSFDVDQAVDFVERNRNKSPEPNAP